MNSAGTSTTNRLVFKSYTTLANIHMSIFVWLENLQTSQHGSQENDPNINCTIIEIQSIKRTGACKL